MVLIFSVLHAIHYLGVFFYWGLLAKGSFWLQTFSYKLLNIFKLSQQENLRSNKSNYLWKQSLFSRSCDFSDVKWQCGEFPPSSGVLKEVKHGCSWFSTTMKTLSDFVLRHCIGCSMSLSLTILKIPLGKHNHHSHFSDEGTEDNSW